MSLLKTRSAKNTLQKMPIFEESTLSKQEFSTQVDRLAGRFNYRRDQQSAKERFVQAVRRYKRVARSE